MNDQESSALAEIKLISTNQPKVKIDINEVLNKISEKEATGNASSSSAQLTEVTSVQSTNHDNNAQSAANSDSTNDATKDGNKRGVVSGPHPSKPLQKKAKVLRQERKLEKQLAKASGSMGDVAAIGDNTSSSIKKPKNAEQTLQSLIDATPTDGKHKLKVNF